MVHTVIHFEVTMVVFCLSVANKTVKKLQKLRSSVMCMLVGKTQMGICCFNKKIIGG